MAMDGLKGKKERFVQEYMRDRNGAAAARRAGYSVNAARQTAYMLLREPAIAEAIQKAQAERAERLKLEAQDIIQPLWDAYTTDPNEVVQYRRTCCRHCYGAGFRYQRTPGEMERDREQHAAEVRAAKDAKKARPPAFDEKGGIGYDKRKDPHPDCPECFGEGRGEVFIPDTRKLTPEQLALYAGVRETKDGIEVKLHDATARGTLLMRHLGLLADRVDHTTKGEKLPAPSAEPAVINVTIGGK